MNNKFNIWANVFALTMLLINAVSLGTGNLAINWFAYAIGAIYIIDSGIWWYREGNK